MKIKLGNLISKLKSSKYGAVAIIVAALILVVVVGLGGYALLRNTKKDNIKKTTEELATKVKITREVIINGKSVIAELASTPEERMRGLMGREILEDGTGLLFPFGQEGVYTFWMKNMKISIDIIWIGANMTVIDTDLNIPPCSDTNCEYYTPSAPIKYVLEVPANWFTKNGLNIGDAVSFVDLVNKDVSTSPAQ